jgi:hypothetical protein
MEPTKRCPYCAEEILIAAIKCKHCGSALADPDPDLAGELMIGPAPPSILPLSQADYGWALLGLPIVGAILMWVWAESLIMLSWPAAASRLVTLSVVIGTAILAATEARRLGMTYNRREGTYSSVQWAASLLLLWIIGYPAYLFKRRRFDRRNLLIPGIMVAFIFLISSGVTRELIEQKSADFQRASADLDSLSESPSGQPERVANVVRQQSAADKPRPPPTSSSSDQSIAVAQQADAQNANAPDDLLPVTRGDSLPALPPPSFDCIKANSQAEHLICNDEELATLDRENAVIYIRARSVAPDEMEFIRRSRKEWLRREHECTEKSCLIEWYATRKRELSALIDAASEEPAK